MRQFLLLAFAAAIMAGGCGNADYQRTNDGLYYRIIHSGKGDLIKPRTFLKIHQSAEMGDTLFFSTFGKIPTYGFFDSVAAPAHEFLDILDQMRVGDSAVVIRSVDTLVKRGITEYNKRFVKGGTIKVLVKVLASYTSEAEYEKARLKDIEDFKQNEIKELSAYMAEKNEKNVEKLPQGVFVQILKEGSGIKVDSGMNVKMNYTGKLFNGTVFDSNLDSTFGHAQPLEFIVGSRQVIEGWDIGVQKLKVGTKARLIIPSMLGYGMQGSGPKLPPYSNLIFDVEVLDAAFPAAAKSPQPAPAGAPEGENPHHR